MNVPVLSLLLRRFSLRHARLAPRATALLVGILADGGLDQWRPGQVDAGATAHQHHVVRQARQVGPARGGGAVHHGDLRNAGGRQAGLVGEAAPAFYEDLGLIQQVGAARLHQADQRQLVLPCDLLGT